VIFKNRVPGIRKIVAGACHLVFICPDGLAGPPLSGVFVFGLRQTSILVLFYFINKKQVKAVLRASQWRPAYRRWLNPSGQIKPWWQAPATIFLIPGTRFLKIDSHFIF
jgi:hypothetical protein